MPQNQSHIQMLFQRFSDHQASPEEVKELFRLVAQEGNDHEFIALLELEMEMSELVNVEDQKRRDQVLSKIKEVIGVIEGEPAVPAKKSNFRWLAIAASVMLVMGAAVFFFRSGQTDNNQGKLVNDLAPGKVGATLTLANGRKIRLSEAGNGEIAKEAGISVTKTADGQLVYQIKEEVAQTDKINTLSTAKGETYILTLPDQSKVWMNAASSLTYSATLMGRGVRRVKLVGEAYFEIAKDKAHPFIVESKGQQVQVLGTHFNVNAYEDEPATMTTLLEGSVKVTSGTNKEILKPGEQSKLSSSGSISIQQVDVDNAVAWKKGYFQFENENLESIMRKVARWYDVEVIYQDSNLKKLAFMGTVSKYKNVSQILKTLQMTNELDFRIEGKRILISAHQK